MTTLSKRILLRMYASDSAFFTADITWESSDPQALSVLFHAANGDVAWVFARDLVQRAYTFGHSGEGDVQCRLERGYLILKLSSGEGGNAEACTDAAELTNFMAQTYNVVPSSMEGAAYGSLVDEALDQIFGAS